MNGKARTADREDGCSNLELALLSRLSLPGMPIEADDLPSLLALPNEAKAAFLESEAFELAVMGLLFDAFCSNGDIPSQRLAICRWVMKRRAERHCAKGIDDIARRIRERIGISSPASRAQPIEVCSEPQIYDGVVLDRKPPPSQGAA